MKEIPSGAFRGPQPEEPVGSGELGKMRKQRRALNRLLARAEEKERCRIARELHDTTAQDLVAIDLNLHRIGRNCTEPRDRALFSETRDLLKRAQREIRTMSFLLHPPPVAEGGLAWALEQLVDQYSERMGLPIAFETNFSGRLSEEVETHIYRMVQEALTNVHRHANATGAIVRCRRTADSIIVEIEDDGIGMESGERSHPGVGLRNILERAREIGGTLTVLPLYPGTMVRTVFPAPSQGELELPAGKPDKAAWRAGVVHEGSRKSSQQRNLGNPFAAHEEDTSFPQPAAA